jgi:hypothetical protein
MGRPLVPVDLNIPFFNQETDMWCWAAVSQMVIAHFKGIDATPPQREIARMALGEDAERWRDGVPDDAMRAISRCGGVASIPLKCAITICETAAQHHMSVSWLKNGMLRSTGTSGRPMRQFRIVRGRCLLL